MFEAHIYNADTTSGNNTAGSSICAPVLCWHPSKQANLAVWSTAGKRTGIEKHFVYFEYRRADNSHGVKKTEITGELDLPRLQSLAASQQVDDLDISNTEQWHQQRRL